MKVCVLIPSVNEESTIKNVVTELKRLGCEVLVVDDGSTDNTGKIASENGARIIRHAKNMGKGASLKDGFSFLSKNTDCDNVITMDADGQHNPKDIQKFIDHVKNHECDLVIGSRMKKTKNMPPMRFLTNRLMSFLVSLMCGQRIPDTQCGYRLIKRNVLEKLDLKFDNFEVESEILIKASRNKFKIDSIPIETIYRGEASRINPVIDTFRFLVFLIKILLIRN